MGPGQRQPGCVAPSKQIIDPTRGHAPAPAATPRPTTPQVGPAAGQLGLPTEQVAESDEWLGVSGGTRSPRSYYSTDRPQRRSALRSYAVPEGWNHGTVEICFWIPNEAATAPYGFYVRPALLLTNGAGQTQPLNDTSRPRE